MHLEGVISNLGGGGGGSLVPYNSLLLGFASYFVRNPAGAERRVPCARRSILALSVGCRRMKTNYQPVSAATPKVGQGGLR